MFHQVPCHFPANTVGYLFWETVVVGLLKAQKLAEQIVVETKKNELRNVRNNHEAANENTST